MTPSDRRGFMLGLAATATTVATTGCASTTVPNSLALPAVAGGAAPTDTAFWSSVRALYDTSPAITNLENGYWGIMAEPVRRDYLAWTDRINRENSFYARTALGATWSRCARNWPPPWVVAWTKSPSPGVPPKPCNC